MSWRTEILAKAHLEFLEAWIWYEERQMGLGDRFRQKVFDCIKLIEKNPESFSKKKKAYRQAAVKIFPYVLIFRVNKRKKAVAIVSVFHTRRNPRKKFLDK